MAVLWLGAGAAAFLYGYVRYRQKVQTLCLVEKAPEINLDRLNEPTDEVELVYREIIRKAGAYLKPGGHLLFEIGYDQAEAVSMLMQTQGYEEIEVIQDLAGLDRVVKGKRKQEELHV